MKKEETTAEEIQKKEKFVTRIIVMISIFIGVLITLLLMGVMDFIIK